jgi:hypothetical protein
MVMGLRTSIVRASAAWKGVAWVGRTSLTVGRGPWDEKLWPPGGICFLLLISAPARNLNNQPF